MTTPVLGVKVRQGRLTFFRSTSLAAEDRSAGEICKSEKMPQCVGPNHISKEWR